MYNLKTMKHLQFCLECGHVAHIVRQYTAVKGLNCCRCDARLVQDPILGKSKGRVAKAADSKPVYRKQRTSAPQMPAGMTIVTFNR